MASFNTVTVVGHLTRDTEIRYTQSGAPVGNGAIAVNRKYKSGDELKEEVSFFDFVVWGKTAEAVAQHTGKGSLVLLDGRLQQRRWETDDGQKRSKIEIVAETVQFLGGKKSGASGEPSAARARG